MQNWKIALCALVFGLLSACKAIIAPDVQPFATGEDWILKTPLRYQIGNTSHVITVPAGFVTDYASIPRCFCLALPVHGRYDSAAIVHDFLYWDQSCTKGQVDHVLYAAMRESGVSAFKAGVILKGVQLGGSGAWKQNTADRAEGLPRLLPPEERSIPPDALWPDYRKMLRNKGVKDYEYERPTSEDCAAAEGKQ